MTLTICIKKRGRKRTYQHRRQRWHIDTTTRRLHRKTRTRTNYSHQKWYWNTMDNRMTITRKKWKEKQLYERFKWLINNISHDKTWTWLRKGKCKRETESLLMAAQKSTLRTNHIKAKIDKTQQNSKCRRQRRNDQSHNKRMQQISTEWVWSETRLGGQGDQLGNVQEI